MSKMERLTQSQVEKLTFDDVHVLDATDFIRITTREVMHLQKGEVVMVRSDNVPEKGDHYVLITGHPIQKPHGIRPQTIEFPVNKVRKNPLDTYEKQMGVILLKLNPRAKKLFHRFYDITVTVDGVNIGEPINNLV